MTFHDGSRLLVLPENGRALGLYPAECHANFLWTNPALAEAASAKAYFARAGWPNPGGDRTWLAPELAMFIGNPAKPFDTYAVPATLDPGNWKLASCTASGASLENRTRLRLFRPDRDVGLRMTKTYSPAANPLQDSSPACAGLQYAGYTLTTTLELDPQPDVPVRLGIWNLLQLPQPGAMLIPVKSAIRPQVFFGPVTENELTIESRLVRWNMGPPGGDAKIGIKARALTGRAGYIAPSPTPRHATRDTLLPTPDTCALVVREFTVGSERDYVDALWQPPNETGWGFQACCVRSGAECFNELEYHAPAVTATAGKNISRDESRVWAFRGPADAIVRAAKALLDRSVEL